MCEFDQGCVSMNPYINFHKCSLCIHIIFLSVVNKEFVNLFYIICIIRYLYCLFAYLVVHISIFPYIHIPVFRFCVFGYESIRFMTSPYLSICIFAYFHIPFYSICIFRYLDIWIFHYLHFSIIQYFDI